MRETTLFPPYLRPLPPKPEHVLRRYEPLALLLMFRAVVAAFGDLSISTLRHMSLAETMAEAVNYTRFPTLKLLVTVGGLSLDEARELFEAAKTIAEAQTTLSLVPQPSSYSVRANCCPDCGELLVVACNC